MELTIGAESKRTLLIIGAGLEQTPAYKLARDKGYRVVGTDMDRTAPAFQFADDCLIASTRDVDETCEVVGDYAKKQTIDGVMTIANDVPYTVARVAQMLRLPGADPEAVRKLINKVHMKTAFTENGVATPAFVKVTNQDELKDAENAFKYPYILKPSDGRGAKGVLLVDDDTDKEWAFAYAKSYCANDILVAEEYYPGRQFSVEGMFIGGRYKAVAFADRNYDNLGDTKPYIVEDGGTIPSSIGFELEAKIEDVIERGSKALGLDWGTVKADIVLDNHGAPSIIELAGRLSGNYLATHHIPYAYGVDIVSCVMDLSLGLNLDVRRLEPRYKKYLGVRYFFPKPGRLTGIRGQSELAGLSYIHELLIYLNKGDLQPKITHHGARAGTVMTTGDTYQEATSRAIAVASKIQFDIEPTEL